MNDTKFGKLVIAINGLLPLAMMAWDGYYRQMGANPLEFITHTTGTLTLIFLTLTLLITPLRRLTNWQILIKYRRMVGLFAFFYGSLHFLSYVWFDKFFNIVKIAQDVVNRQFIAIGMIAFFSMVPLAITSTNKMLKRLGGQRWLKLHRLVYYSAVIGLLHYWMSVKADTSKPIIFAIIFALLLGYRFLYSTNRKSSVNSLNIGN